MFTKLRQQPASLIPRSEIPTQPYGRASCIKLHSRLKASLRFSLHEQIWKWVIHLEFLLEVQIIYLQTPTILQVDHSDTMNLEMKHTL